MIGREEQLGLLNEYFQSDKNNLTILYGRHNTGKTELIKEFIKDKKALYFNALPAVDFELMHNFVIAAGMQSESVAGSEKDETLQNQDYESVFDSVVTHENVQVIVIENFNNIVRVDSGFIADVAHFIKVCRRKVMFILTCSSVQWVENAMVKSIGPAAFSINAFMKLKQIEYSSVVSMFPEMDPKSGLYAYAVTGGFPGYLTEWNDKDTVRNNICRLFLDADGPLNKEAELYVSEEFRETSVYNTILACLAAGRNKLNEIHEYTGFGRDKISVYLNNLIEREIVEKIFSFDAGNSKTTKKGLYHIQDGFINFWYKFIYPNYGLLGIISSEEFYDKFIAEGIEEFVKEAFINVGCEFLDIMSSVNRLAVTAEYKGRWYGKKGDIHIVYSGDEGDVIGQVHTGNQPFDSEDYEEFAENFSVAGVKPKQIFIFSTAGFTDRFINSRDDMTMLVRIEDL